MPMGKGTYGKQVGRPAKKKKAMKKKPMRKTTGRKMY
tara:strand:+ start:1683 stop:1793 length:111 start_codon:yes stop_codon:yes gene_type:complete